MADDTFNPLVWLMDIVADAVDWIHETFSDPALSSELRSDLGVDDEVEPQGTLPTGDKIRMRHPNGDPIDVDKAAFDATVAEVKAAYGLLVDFFGALGLSVERDLGLPLPARPDRRVRVDPRVPWLPIVHAGYRAGDRRRRPASSSSEDVEASTCCARSTCSAASRARPRT